MMQRTHAAPPRSTPWLSCAWHKRLILGVLVVLLSLCHGVLAPVSAATAGDGPAVAAATDDGPPFRECTSGKRLVALSERRGTAAALDLPAETPVCTAHLPEAARGLRVAPPPIPENARAFLQVFRL